jgi:hypothetical protein
VKKNLLKIQGKFQRMAMKNPSKFKSGRIRAGSIKQREILKYWKMMLAKTIEFHKHKN